ncbi:glyoxylase-like metal-dependent hydrolase (beta-lactamase superfamily II) [Micromonospora kangleipakensis]|uniref:Glyoxylase-like metal-dependent hydrolase (Beta-lactamase superfamily II) n=1 Tax=Micromonospora kangleipakensis TaxID=1077942 RepID=A0A4Q8BEC7_9ACTN|nr:MBL fold metallo-hydrolase [Micromonospora kangleipakensis]RZU76280.1 glyoxylase-like metal-dependent hydrolase (beta-lactamase superfamily II) [Micromonospora kangleipakensis]
MARSAAVPLAPGVWRIPTVGRALVNSYAFVGDDGSVTLVDCGLKRAPARIVRGLAAIGKTPADVTGIVLTHAHPDHAGGAAELSRRTGAPVAAHTADVPYAESGQVPPHDPTITAGRFLARLAGGRFPAVEVACPLADGDVLAVGGGLRVLHTPGHSPGHVSLLHEPTRVLVTGDALFNVAGVRWPVKSFCTDFRMTQRTAHVLGELDYDVAAFTHGPEITNRAREQVRAFLSRLR